MSNKVTEVTEVTESERHTLFLACARFYASKSLKSDQKHVIKDSPYMQRVYS
jgi:hypothetical protein